MHIQCSLDSHRRLGGTGGDMHKVVFWKERSSLSPQEELEGGKCGRSSAKEVATEESGPRDNLREAATGSGVVKYPSGNQEDIGPQGGKPRRQWEMCMGRSLQDRWGRRENRGNTRHVISNKTQTLAHTHHTCIPSHTTWSPKAATYCDNMYLKIQKCMLPNVMITFKQINLLCTKIQHKF